MKFVKTFFISIVVSLFSMSASATGSENFEWDAVIAAIVQVESGGNLNAKNGIYIGPMQIAPVLVQECNNILQAKKSSKRFTLADRTNMEKCKEMFILIQEKYNPTNNVEYAIRSWNQGPRYSVKATQGYYNKVMKALNN